MIEDCLLVEVLVTDDDCPLAEATRAVEVPIDARPPQLREDGNVLLEFSAPTNESLRRWLDADDRIRYLHVASTHDRDTFRCLSKHPCIVHALISGGLIVETIRYRDGGGTFFGAVVGREVLEGVMERAGEAVGVTLNRIYPLESEARQPASRRWDITPKQEACLRTAYRMGYFSVPKAVTADEVAEELGISKSAFLERLRRGQSALFSDLFVAGELSREAPKRSG